MTAVIQLTRVTKRYHGDPPLEVLRDVNLEIESGELVAVVGPSGSGKSTLLHIAGTLDRPTEGQVTIAGHEVSQMTDREVSAVRARRVGFVFQQFFLVDGMTALDNVAEGLLYSGTRLRERRRLAYGALDQVGLRHRVTHLPTQLSGGERQRVAIARAVVHQPAIVLADEPTGNLDSASGAGVVSLLRELHRDGTTITVITHNEELASALPRQVTMRDGRIT